MGEKNGLGIVELYQTILSIIEGLFGKNIISSLLATIIVCVILSVILSAITLAILGIKDFKDVIWVITLFIAVPFIIITVIQITYIIRNN